MPNPTQQPPQTPQYLDPNPGTTRKLTVNTTLNDAASRNGINQIRGVARANSLGSGIPKHVTTVHALTNVASTGATTSIGVTFHQDPTDENFAGVDVYVKGYQNNNSLVKVGGGAASPVNFVLNNTGENISLVVQARGNAGSAPITSAPSVAVNLGQSTIGGFGLSAQTGILAVDPNSGQSVVNSPTLVSNAVSQGGLLSQWTAGNTIQFPGVIEVDALAATNGVIPILLLTGQTSSKPNGYVIQIDVRSGQKPLTVQTIVSGTWQSIGTYSGTNAANLTGWQHCRVELSRINSTNTFKVFFNGVLKATVSDSSAQFLQNVPTYYGYGASAMTIAPAGWTQKTADHLPDGTTSFLGNANFIFAQGTQVVSSLVSPVVVNPTVTSGNPTLTFPSAFSWQCWVSGTILDVHIPDGSNHSYAFRIDGRSGQSIGQIFKYSSVSGVTGARIGSQLYGANAANVTGWYDCYAFYNPTGILCLYVNGQLAAQAADTTYTPNGTTGYWSAVSNNVKIGPSPTVKVGSTFLNGQGNLSTGTSNTFSYTSTTTSIKWTWTAFTLYGADGSILSVPANSTGTTFSSLTASTTYQFGFTVTMATGVCSVIKSDVTGGTGAFSAQAVQQTLQGDGLSVIAYNIAAATPASGSGGGSGGGSTGGPHTKI